MEMRKCYYLKRLLPNDGQHALLPFKKDEIVIGRSVDSTHIIPYQLISRRHAVFRRRAGNRWTVSNLSLNGVFVDGKPISNGEEYDINVGATVQFGQPATFLYRFGMKEIPLRPERTSNSHSTISESEGDSSILSRSLPEHLSQEHAILERQLKESDALQIRLQQERNQLRHSLDKQKKQLQEKYQNEKEQLENLFTAGSLAQQVMLEEKEALAQRLEMQVSELQGRLEEERKSLEESLRKEEEQRNCILQEKENVLQRLEEEKTNLELKLQEERHNLQEQLKATETHKEELQKQVEAKESAIRAKELEQQQAEKERQRLKDELAQERLKLVEELESVKNVLAEKELTNALLGSELKEKELELQNKLSSMESGMKAKVTEEVEKSAAIVREELTKQLEQVLQDKSKLEQQVHAQDHDQSELSNLQEALQVVEAQKMSLEQELASTAVATEHARKEVVESVSDVLENEFQCPICSELFITAIMLSCSHTFCRYCIDQWKKNKRDCPSCRHPISSETRSLVIDNFIEKLIPTLSDEMKKRRNEIVAERKAEMEAAAMAQAQVAAEAAARAQRGRRGRGRRRGRVNQGRSGLGGHAYAGNVAVHRLPHHHVVVAMHKRERAQLIPTVRLEFALPNSIMQHVPGLSFPQEMGSNFDGTPVNNRTEISQGSANNPVYIQEQDNPTARLPIPHNHHSGSTHDYIEVGANEQLSTYSSRQRPQPQAGPNRTLVNESHQARSQRTEHQYLGFNDQASVSHTSETENVEVISLSSNSGTTDTSMNSDSSSVSGEEENYRPVYGRCFSCGRRGHWAYSCPYRW